MRMLHKIFLIFSLCLILFGLFVFFSEVSSDEDLVQLEGLTVGETFIPDERVVLESAIPIYIEGSNNKAVLIFHGYLASPQEVEELANYLGDQDYTVLAPLMQGHGTDPSDLENIDYEVWQSEAMMYYEALSSSYDSVQVVGFSLGSLSALHLAEIYELDSVVAIGPPFYIGNKILENVNLSEVFLEISEYVPYIYNHALSDMIIGREMYDQFPLESVLEILEYSEEVKPDLSLITERVLLIHGQFDTTADPEGSDLVYETINSEDKELLEVASMHPVLMGIHKEEVFEKIYSFLEETT
jgi:carboxylesterase